ncbi:MAG: hypothetical protein MZV65_01935 [Chromatiales bacterium]|nr:hypothetical protein [Chromatiales bacterium]
MDGFLDRLDTEGHQCGGQRQINRHQQPAAGQDQLFDNPFNQSHGVTCCRLKVIS